MSTQKSPQKPLPVAIVAGLDILLIGAGLCVFALFHHVLPRAYATGQTSAAASTPAATSVTTIAFAGGAGGQDISVLTGNAGGAALEAGAGNATLESATATDLGGGEFAAKFTDGNVIATATSYVSANVNVTLSQVQRDGVTYHMEDLGCRVAYNLDGGKTAAMTFGDSLANQPAQGGRTTSDIIYIGE